MQAKLQRITPFLWFTDKAEEAVGAYIKIFDNSRIITTTRYNKEMSQAAGRPEGSVMTIGFALDGQEFTAINGGPAFKLTEAVSFVVNCETQQEIDHYWMNLSEGGDPKAQQCGWLKDRFGLSWQVVPKFLLELLTDPDPKRHSRGMQAMLKMKKIDVQALRQAADGRG